MAYNDAVNNILTADNFYGANPYSQFSGSPLPWPSSYAGTPTDAQGRPIQAQPGTTLNTPPAAAAAPATASPTASLASLMQTPAGRAAYAEGLAGPPHQISAGGQITGGQAGAQGGANQGLQGGMNTPAQYSYGPAPQAAAPQAAASTGAPGTQSLDSALALLSNPGHVTTPGANMNTAPQGPSVLQSFLANNQGGTGAGNYSNQSFFNTLNALRGGAQPGAAP
jgi:hypothetical protein